MRRREFLAAAASAACWPGLALAQGLPRDLKITRIIGFDLFSRRAKLVGKNARRDVHGDRARDHMVRIFTNSGVEGLGNCWVSKQVLGQLIGRRLSELYDRRGARVSGPLGTQTMPLWDLAGKVLGRSVYRLLGGAGPKRVPVYDGSIYFSDLLPQYAGRWQERFKEEIDESIKRGHRAVKVKIGRGAKWMDRAAGDRRDVEVVRLVRRHVGKDFLIGVDANDGYDLAGARQFLDRAGAEDLAFVEEMFPEQVDQCLELKRSIAARGWKTLLADGETQRSLDAYRPLVRAKAVDVLQGDMNRFGIEGIMAEAAMARPQGILVAPHNWGSLVGFFMQLHVARAVPNFYRAEQDPLRSNLLVADGYRIAGGTCRVPDAPGFGLSLDERRFKDAKILFDLK
jgi:D-galactarolactone cycloisomerase